LAKILIIFLEENKNYILKLSNLYNPSLPYSLSICSIPSVALPHFLISLVQYEIFSRAGPSIPGITRFKLMLDVLMKDVVFPVGKGKEETAATAEAEAGAGAGALWIVKSVLIAFHIVIPLTEEIHVGVSAETICARTASDQAILPGNAQMLLFVTTVIFLDVTDAIALAHCHRMHHKSLCWNCREPGHMANNCPNEGIATPVGRQDIVLESVQLQLCPLEGPVTWHVIVQMIPSAICATYLDTSPDSAPKPTFSESVEEEVCGGGGGGGGGRSSGYRDIVCRNCQQLGHMSRGLHGALDDLPQLRGTGSPCIRVPSGRFMDHRYSRRY
ncbi:hypothetical protein F8388_024088, partial [Cannabis sativa]